MFQRWWHRQFGHKWVETAFRVPANPERGQFVDVWTLLRRCDCGAAGSAQVVGDVVEVAKLDHTKVVDNEEINALRKMAGLGPLK
jgi:hypothetical protein